MSEECAVGSEETCSVKEFFMYYSSALLNIYYGLSYAKFVIIWVYMFQGTYELVTFLMSVSKSKDKDFSTFSFLSIESADQTNISYEIVQ